MSGWTRRTITSRAKVEYQWARVRRLGIAVNHEETIVGAIFLAAPILDAEHKVCGAISLGIPKARFSATLGRAMASALKDTCARISETLASAGHIHNVGAPMRLMDRPETAARRMRAG